MHTVHQFCENLNCIKLTEIIVLCSKKFASIFSYTSHVNQIEVCQAPSNYCPSILQQSASHTHCP